LNQTSYPISQSSTVIRSKHQRFGHHPKTLQPGASGQDVREVWRRSQSTKSQG